MRSGSDRRSNWPPVIFRNACTGSGKARLNNPQLGRVRWAGAGLAQSGEICCLQLLLRSPSPRALTFPAAVAPNGGGSDINRYSFVFDVLLPSVSGYSCFFNTK